MSDDKPKIKRDAAATKERILRAGMAEFGAKGYGGARTEDIATRAKCNIRMLYHYFGGKKDLYIACLERVYSHIREEERKLKLEELEPVEAIRKLVGFTFDHMRNNPDFVHIAGVENTQRGKFIKKVRPVANAAVDLIETIERILKAGADSRVLRDDIDAFQLYISILSLSYLHLSNRFTLSATYGRDLSDSNWLDERREHVEDMVVSYVRPFSVLKPAL
ncbi:TetR/AcrR family transcriptional regulator [Pelagibius sp. Alg239-R121]|uniref:TetR/AcrR family transcriptional regulator n=1 Tax=Pelagibius sp. Alg239-R121 TaxID=2993448 RepID=UPI0024A61559|nr:TetR/AcrR family transcriptional regulator [Pelagibius sp. Alg239-R121]